jgi:hypothetical protein
LELWLNVDTSQFVKSFDENKKRILALEESQRDKEEVHLLEMHEKIRDEI